MNSSFTVLDGVVLLAYLVGTTLLGVWLGRSQRDARDYFVAGQAVPWWAVLFSVVATETSALTFISIPGLAYATDLTFLQVAAGYLLGRIVIAFTLLPKYYDGKLVTAYALLEQRAPSAHSLPRDEALAELTRRYFRSHGPATINDFQWWSTLSIADIKRGLEMLASALTQETIEDTTYWFEPTAPPPRSVTLMRTGEGSPGTGTMISPSSSTPSSERSTGSNPPATS